MQILTLTVFQENGSFFRGRIFSVYSVTLIIDKDIWLWYYLKTNRVSVIIINNNAVFIIIIIIIMIIIIIIIDI